MISDDIDRNTTLVYRAPEMIDLFRKQLICEKVDIWALGCLLYKMAYGRDAFEEGGLQILNGKWSIPPYTTYSKDLTSLISFMLVQDPIARPHIGQVIARVSTLLKKPNPLPNFKPYDHSASSTTTTSKGPVHPMSTLRVSAGSTSTTTAPKPRGPSTSASPAPAAPQAAPAAAAGGGDLFSMLEWEQDAPGGSSSGSGNNNNNEGAFDFFGGQQEGAFAPAVSASPAPVASAPQGAQGQQQQQQGGLDFFADFGGSSATGSASSASVQGQGAFGGNVTQSAGSNTSSLTSSANVNANSFFEDDNNSFFNAAPVLQPQQPSTSPKPQQQGGKQKEEQQLKKSAEDIQADVYSNWLK